MLVSRKLINNNAKPEKDFLTELKLPRVVNHIFEMTCSLDLFLIEIGVSLPFSGSLLIIARKVNKTNENAIQ